MKYSTFLLIKEVQIKTTPHPIWNGHIRGQTNAAADVVKQEHLYTVGGNAN
jgi:hypothetical protein